MIEIKFTTRDGEQHKIEATAGTSLMETTRNAGFDDLQAICGGCASCATCHVYVENLPDGAKLPDMSEDEDDLLDGLFYRQDNSRLSCQIPMHPSLNGMEVIAPPED